MATARERNRCCERLTELSGSSLDVESMQREAIANLQRVIGFDQWCWPYADPQTLVPLSGIADHAYGLALARALEIEYSGADIASMGELARRPHPVASLSAETGGDLARSPRWDEVLRAAGIGDEAVLACRDALGCWGWIKVYRESADRDFAIEDLELLAQVGPSLGSALRRKIGGANGGTRAALTDSGVVVLDRDLRPVSWTEGARAWIATLPLADMFAMLGMLPAAVYPTAALARSSATAGQAHALERGVDGRWVKIEAAPLDGDDDGRIAVVVRGAAPAETFELLCRAYALTLRERELVAALIAGLDTRAVTEQLFISRHTVQDHLKSIFAKIGVHSRRELLATFAADPGAFSEG